MNKEYFKKHLSLCDWAIQTNLSNKESLVKEDSTKRNRLNTLSDIIGLPVVKSFVFSYDEITNRSVSFTSFLEGAEEKHHALRATPNDKGLPIFRNRKLSVSNLLNWLMEQKIDFEKYSYSFELHIDPELATIFIVEDNRIIGEFAHGSILQLNKGIHDDKNSIYFEFDFKNWQFSDDADDAKFFLEKVFDLISLKGKNKQTLYETDFLESKNSVYLKGYFEVISSNESGIVFIDYNRSLKNNLDGIDLFKAQRINNKDTIKGNVGSTGKVIGRAKVVNENEIENAFINSDEVLVCHFTSPDYLPLMTASIAVITDIGGILSHAAIVCRELKKPCVIGTKVATQRIKTGDLLEVDAFEGYIRFL